LHPDDDTAVHREEAPLVFLVGEGDVITDGGDEDLVCALAFDVNGDRGIR